MDRGVLGGFIGSLLGLSSLGSLGALGFIFSGGTGAPAPADGAPSGGWRLLEPVTYENLSVCPVVSGSSNDTSEFLTLDEGLASGEVQVREQGSEGMVRNRDGRDGIVRPTY